jgi:hypothetical protein
MVGSAARTISAAAGSDTWRQERGPQWTALIGDKRPLGASGRGYFAHRSVIATGPQRPVRAGGCLATIGIELGHF